MEPLDSGLRCWTMKIGELKLAGSCLRRVLSACSPPAEVPMTMIRVPPAKDLPPIPFTYHSRVIMVDENNGMKNSSSPQLKLSVGRPSGGIGCDLKLPGQR